MTPADAPRFPNPPLDEIHPRDLATAKDAAPRLGVRPGTIRVWDKRGKVEPVIEGDARRPAVYYYPALARAERDAWYSGAKRDIRGGRHPDWRPGTSVPTPQSTAA